MKVARRYVSADEKQMLEIFDHENGFFSFEEAREDVEDIPEYGTNVYWKILQVSGLYDSMDAADQDAKACAPWARDNGHLQSI